eukprot:TRINITY_DN49655_c0_g1_i1.p1 TRINITY_DN49655_c0_g1~~TRINITY_DN49655_c0_g1_i1.p1  ORF type:complete len:131 (+),score=25.84 TRINITY_DN49655_c0_g1_i1:138-530(+)
MIRRPPRSTLSSSSAASDVYKRQPWTSSLLRTLENQSDNMNFIIKLVHRESYDMVLGSFDLRRLLVMNRVRVLLGFQLGSRSRTPLRKQTGAIPPPAPGPVSYTHLRAHETPEHLVCRLLLEKKKKQNKK